MAGPNDLSGDTQLPGGNLKLWIMPGVLELFAFPFAWISVQMLHDHETWSAIAEYAVTGIILCIAGIVWAVFRKRIAELSPWRQLRVTKAELADMQQENLELAKSLNEARGMVPAQQPSKLVIQAADYRAVNQSGRSCDVTECLQKMVKGDSLVLQIENHNFVVDGKNYVPEDPSYGHFKRLRVTYYFDGGSPRVAERPEHKQIVLPEDTFLIEQIVAVQRQTQLETNQFNAELSRAREAYRQCEEERKKVLQSDGSSKLAAILNPLQIEALTIAKELRDFLASLPPFPKDPQQYPDESDYDYTVRVNSSGHLQKVFQERREKQGQWRLKLMHGYANRKFGERVAGLLHQAGEELEYPAYNADYAQKPPFGLDDVRKLAQEMEMVAIWINRKERGETNLLK